METQYRAKRYLSRIRNIDRKIVGLKSTLANSRDSLTVGGMSYDEPHIRSQPGDKMSAKVAKLVDLEREISREIAKMIELKCNTLVTICRIDDYEQQNILIARYIDLMTWDEIAYEYHKSNRQVYRIHRNALQALDKILNEEDEICE